MSFFDDFDQVLKQMFPDETLPILTWNDRKRTDLPKRYIVYNTENLHVKGNNEAYMRLIRGAERVYDYSKRNLAVTPNTSIYFPIQKMDHGIDVLFYGDLSQRRAVVLDELKKQGIRVHYSNQSFGDELIALIAKSKFVLSIHHSIPANNDDARIQFALSLKAWVIAEKCDDYNYISYPPNVFFIDYDNMIPYIIKLCKR